MSSSASKRRRPPTPPTPPKKGNLGEAESPQGQLIPDFMRRMTRHIAGFPWENTELFSKEAFLYKAHNADADLENVTADFADVYWSAKLEYSDFFRDPPHGDIKRRDAFIVGYDSETGFRRDLLVFDPYAADDAPHVSPVVYPSNSTFRHIFNRTLDSVVRRQYSARFESLFKRFRQPEAYRQFKDFEERTRPIAVVVKTPPLAQHAATPSNAQSVDTGSGFDSSVGVIASDGVDMGITVAYHALTNGSTVGYVGQSVIVGGSTGVVKSIDLITDSAFVTFPNGGCPINTGRTLAVRTTPAPGYGQAAEFDGIGSGKKNTVVVASSPTLLYRHPAVQRQVLTNPDSLPGDSGCALVSNNELLGFCFGGSGTTSPLLFSLWIWADSVFTAHNLT
ncbi:MAG: hypothetical protein R3F13_15015 [Prosthecobacter sp.]